MSLVLKQARAPARRAAAARIAGRDVAMGDPGLLSGIGGALKGAVKGFVTGGPVGAVKGGIVGGVEGFRDDPSDPAPRPRTAPPTPRPPGIGGGRLPLPGGGAMREPRAREAPRLREPEATERPRAQVQVAEGAGPAAANGKVHPAANPGGKFAVSPGGTVIPCPAGFRSNKSRYYRRRSDGRIMEVLPGARCVKMRRRNPLNPRALDRAMGRLSSAKRAAKKIGRITIRKK